MKTALATSKEQYTLTTGTLGNAYAYIFPLNVVSAGSNAATSFIMTANNITSAGVAGAGLTFNAGPLNS